MSGFHGFADKPQRNLVWLELAKASFGGYGGVDASRALGALFNFSSENQVDASKLKLTDRDSDECVARLRTTRPIIIVALTSDVFVRLRAAWLRAGAAVSEFVGPANQQRKNPMPLPAAEVIWSWRGTTSTQTLLVQAPRHPSRPDQLASGVSSMSPEGAVLRWQVLRDTVEQLLAESGADRA